MSEPSSAVIAVEFKDRRVTAPMVDQIVGAALRSGHRAGRDGLRSLIIFCRSHTADAKVRAVEHEQNLGLTIHFTVVEGSGDAS